MFGRLIVPSTGEVYARGHGPNVLVAGLVATGISGYLLVRVFTDRTAPVPAAPSADCAG